MVMIINRCGDPMFVFRETPQHPSLSHIAAKKIASGFNTRLDLEEFSRGLPDELASLLVAVHVPRSIKVLENYQIQTNDESSDTLEGIAQLFSKRKRRRGKKSASQRRASKKRQLQETARLSSLVNLSHDV